MCLILLQKTYAELLTYETAILDGTISSGSLPLNEPTGGVAKDAFVAVRQWAQWFEEAGASTSSGPSVWEPALKAEILARFAQAIRPAEYGVLVNDASRQLQTAIDTYAVNDFSDATQMFGVAALSPQRVRLFVIRNCVRRRPRFMPPVAEVDAALKWAMRQLSSRGAWQFRIRDITIAIPTSSGGSSPSITGWSRPGVDRVPTVPLVTLGGNRPPAGLGWAAWLWQIDRKYSRRRPLSPRCRWSGLRGICSLDSRRSRCAGPGRAPRDSWTTSAGLSLGRWSAP